MYSKSSVVATTVGLILICISVFHSGHVASAVRTCWYKSNGTCMNLDDYYCPIGHKLEHRGCGFKETCCYPVITKTPKYEYGEDQCGIPSSNVNGKVVGGKTATVTNFPWMASLQKSNQPVCGASIVGDRWILTAAHCVATHSSAISIVVGTSSTRTSLNRYSYRHYVDKILKHSQFNMNNAARGFDIALIKLKRPINVGTSLTRRVCLPEQGEDFTDSVCVATGWGYTTEPEGPATSAGGSSFLRMANLPILSKARCRYYAFTYSEHTICAGYKTGGVDTCQGDSGGPLVCQGNDGVWKQAGIVSTGRGCGREGEMGMYTEVSAFTDWINYVMENY